MRRLNGVLLAGFALLVGLFFTVPMAVAVLMSFTPSKFLRLPTTQWSLRWYEEFFASLKWMEGLANSLVVSALTIVISLVIGLLTALAFTRHRFRGSSALYTACLTPVFTPAVIIAMAMLAVAYRTGLWGSHLIIAIGHSLWALPIVVMVLRASLEGLDRSLEEAARGLGASPWQVFYTVIAPLIAPSIFVGALFAFIISINEFVMALFLCGVETETLPRIIYPTLRYSLTPLVAAASGVLVLLTLVVLVLAAWVVNLRKLLA
jgi:ABC-type spermidine/putrescine transport system permease subunit II